MRLGLLEPEFEVKMIKRKHRQMLFMGNGEQSRIAVEELMSQVDNAFTSLSGLQQPGHPTSAEEWEAEKKEIRGIRIEIERTVRDLACALTGKEIILYKKKPKKTVRKQPKMCI